MYAGFIISGTGNKQVYIRAIGQGLRPAVNTLLDPKIEVINATTGALVATNDNWNAGVWASQINSLPAGTYAYAPPPDPSDAAMILDLPTGAYIVKVMPTLNSGVGIVGIDDIGGATTARLTNVSTRSPVRQGAENYMYGGFIVVDAPKKFFIRAIGRGLQTLGVNTTLDPLMEIFDQKAQRTIASNDSWSYDASASELVALFKQKNGITPDDTDAGMVVCLEAGVYSPVIKPMGGSSGVGIVAVDDLGKCISASNQCPTATTTNCPDLNQLVIMDGLKPSIGIGIDGDRNAIKSFQCLDGTVSAIDGGSAVFNVNAITSYSDVLRESKKSAGGKISIGFFKAGGGVTEGKYFRQTSYDQSFAMKYVVSLGTQKFFPNPNNPFYSSVEQYKTNTCLLRQYCGDRFVEQTELGAQLYITMNFHFTSEVYKKEFSANANAGISTTLTGKTCTPCGVVTSWSVPISADINASISKLSQTVKQNGTMQVEAIQEGGSVENLASAIGSRFASCSLTNISACTALMDKAINYAATKFADSVRTTQPKVLSYSSNLMATIPGVPLMPSDVTPEIKQARESIAIEYEKRIADKERMELLSATYTLNSTHSRQIATLVQALENDIVALREAGEICFSDLSNCVSKKCNVFNKLTAYSESVFTLGFDEGMVAYYPFNGNALDKSGNGNDGISYNATITQDRFGNPSSAYSFNGTNSYIQVPYSSQFNLSQSSGFSVVLWFNPAATQRPIYVLIDKSHNPPSAWNTGWVIQCMNDGVYGVNNFGFWFGNGSTMTNGANGTCFFDNKWHLVVATFDGLKTNFYIDGNLTGNSLLSGTPSTTNYPLLIGRVYAYNSGFFKGDIDDIRIYNRALSASEVSQLYQLK